MVLVFVNDLLVFTNCKVNKIVTNLAKKHTKFFGICFAEYIILQFENR